MCIQLTGQAHIMQDEESENDIQAAKIVAELSAAGQGAETDVPAGLAENVQVSKKNDCVIFIRKLHLQQALGHKDG